MRIFNAFLVVLTATLLLLFPLSDMAYDFRTDVREDAFTVATAVGVTTGNVTLFREVYDDDTQTISASSNLTSDSPAYSTYNSTTRELEISGLAANTTRALTIEYDIDALSGTPAMDTIADRIAWLWLLMIFTLPVAGIAAIFTGRA